MGHRLTRIYTRTGDAGATGLGDGSRVAKDDARIEALGAVDELNSWLGLLLSEGLGDELHALLTEVQHDLFDLGGELSIPGHHSIGSEHVTRLEQALDRHNAALEPLKEFILPGGSRAAAVCHVARTVCRRAERRVVRLASAQPVAPASLQYLNRLSDLLFVLSRAINRHTAHGDVLWRRNRSDAGSG